MKNTLALTLFLLPATLFAAVGLSPIDAWERTLKPLTREDVERLDAAPRVPMPEHFNIRIGDQPFTDFAVTYARGDRAARKSVRSTFRRADDLAGTPDVELRALVAPFDARGRYSCACPIHPLQVRYYSDFKWSLNDPWRLHCPLCLKEERQYSYYPNPRYPDDGEGCAPTDAVWREDHDAAWSGRNQGIAWDHWDGQTHGYMSTRRFFFKGKCLDHIYRRLGSSTLPTLGHAYQFAANLFPADSPENKRAGIYAHKAKALMLCMARAHFGDTYLRDLFGMTQTQFEARMCGFYRGANGQAWRYRFYPGYHLNQTKDQRPGDKGWRMTSITTVYRGTWNTKADTARQWLRAFALIADSYTPDERHVGLRGMTQRMIVSTAGDAAKLLQVPNGPRRLKRGILEYTLHPYNLMAARDNLAPATLHPTLDLGLLLGDERIVENMAREIDFFMLNQFTGDGVGYEGSPSYTPWGVAGVMNRLQGKTGSFDKTAPWYDTGKDALNCWAMPSVVDMCSKREMYSFPDGRRIAWEDCTVGGGRAPGWMTNVLNAGGKLPDWVKPFVETKRADDGKWDVAYTSSLTLPSWLLHENRKGILRCGKGTEQTVLHLDFGRIVGHYHYAPLSIGMYAKGHELATDLGYLGSTHYLTTSWIKQFASHNTVLLRREDGDHSGMRYLRGDLRTFKSTPTIQFMDAAENDVADWQKATFAKPGVYQRTVALIQVGDNAYGLDLFRVRGGKMHDYFFHAAGNTLEIDGAALTPDPVPDKDLYEWSGFSFPCKPKMDLRHIRELRAGTAPSGWTATWRDITDWRSKPPRRDPDAALRLWMTAGPETQLIAGSAPNQRYIDTRDFGERLQVLCARRTGQEALDTFVGVLEPYRGQPFIEAVTRLPVTGGDETAVCVKVMTEARTDYHLAWNRRQEGASLSVVDGSVTLTTDAEFASCSMEAGEPTSLFMVGGTSLTANNAALRLDTPAYTGRILAFNDLQDTLTLEADGVLPTSTALLGQVIVIQHRKDRSTFTINRISRLEGARYRVHLAHTPHIAANHVLVRDVKGSKAIVEPRLVLAKGAFNLYRIAEDGSAKLLEPWNGERGHKTYADEWGARLLSLQKLHVTKAAKRLAPGDRLALAHTEIGHDTFRITNSAYVQSTKQ
ncbi:MAG: hypothetical protein HN742_10330 [Lentisphaerae bacterium]|nr:hypothetical protein [Lentisphaerota bacterium]MBT4818648.1 hypothetical protein [Lentisphaerota bacterium]MBT5611355.1 hypothetical protein [Lentisphaerota bacterium]MBT7060341.1 hypothetical protein [Lentisphaerota bacterium]MBT7842260.1 hypothetical protein [Lentisphaerota bacterium]